MANFLVLLPYYWELGNADVDDSAMQRMASHHLESCAYLVLETHIINWQNKSTIFHFLPYACYKMIEYDIKLVQISSQRKYIYTCKII